MCDYVCASLTVILMTDSAGLASHTHTHTHFTAHVVAKLGGVCVQVVARKYKYTHTKAFLAVVTAQVKGHPSRLVCVRLCDQNVRVRVLCAAVPVCYVRTESVSILASRSHG